MKVQLERINSSTSEIKIENKILKESLDNVSRKLKDSEQNIEKHAEKLKMKKQKIKKLQNKIDILKNMKKQNEFLNTYSAIPINEKATIYERGKILSDNENVLNYPDYVRSFKKIYHLSSNKQHY